jgi:hypothetical protein
LTSNSEAAFSTLTNVNFDPDRLQQYISTCVALRGNNNETGPQTLTGNKESSHDTS